MADGDTFLQIPSGPPNYQDLLTQLLGSLAPTATTSNPTPVPTELAQQPQTAPVPTAAPASAAGAPEIPNYGAMAPWVQAPQTSSISPATSTPQRLTELSAFGGPNNSPIFGYA